MSPRFFIDRPIFASVLSIVIVVVGLVAMVTLPIAQFPQITPPVVQIDALATQLQDEGAKSFVKSWKELMAVITSKSAAHQEAVAG